MEAALTFVPIAIILAVHTHGLVFTRTLCHPVFDLAKEGQGDHKKAWTSPSSLRARSPDPSSLLLPQTRSPSPWPPPPSDPGVQDPSLFHLIWIQRVLLRLPPGHFKLLPGDADLAVAPTKGVAGPAGPAPHG